MVVGGIGGRIANENVQCSIEGSGRLQTVKVGQLIAKLVKENEKLFPILSKGNLLHHLPKVTLPGLK